MTGKNYYIHAEKAGNLTHQMNWHYHAGMVDHQSADSVPADNITPNGNDVT